MAECLFSQNWDKIDGLNYKVSFFVICSPLRSFISSKSLKNSSKKILPFNFQLSDKNCFFFNKMLLHVIFMFFGCYGRLSLPLATQAVGDVPKRKSN